MMASHRYIKYSILGLVVTLSLIGLALWPKAVLAQDGSISGHVFKADGVTVITDTLISVHAHGITPGSSSLGTYVSQTDGSYTINGLAPGTYKVQANNNLEPGYVTKYYDDKLTWDEADTVEVLAGQDTTAIDFTLEEAGSITGYVYEEDGTTPVDNACVNVSLTAPDWTQVLGWCCTDENGGYSISSLPIGSYYLRTHADCQGSHPNLMDEWYAEGGSTPDGNQADPVQVLAGQTITDVNFSLDQIGIVDLDYVLTIDNPSSGQAAVTMTVSNLSADAFEVEEHGYHGLYVNVLTLSAHDIGGNPLTVEHFPDSGTYDADVWRVQCAGLSQIVIEYTVQPGLMDPGHGHRGYIAPDFAASAGEYVFLVPRNSTAGVVTVSFNLPTGWNAYTPWLRQGDSYDPTIPEADIMDSLSVSDFALGQFDVYTQTVGTTEVAVAAYHSWPTNVKEELAQQSWDIFAYQTSVFGGAVGDYYLAIFCPVAPDGQDIYVGEWSTSQGYSIRFETDGSYWGEWDMFAHQIFHRWSSWAWGISGKPKWFNEGSDVLYEMKTITELRIDRPYGGMEKQLRWYYNTYLEDYVATGNDRALTDPDLDSFLIYRKGAMVNFLLAKEVYLRTDGAHNFDDFLQVVIQKYGHHAAPCYEECLKAELSTLTGTDFTQFFDDYVYGTTTLPMDWAFQDDDIDGLSNALEIGWDTHPEDEDTDGDGYLDGLEVNYGTDPLDPSSVPPDTLITIGMAAPLSGWAKSAGWRQANVTQLAVDQTNAAGGVDIGGTTYTLTLVTADSACDATQAITAANTLLNVGAVAVVGHACSSASDAAQPLYHAAGVPMVSPSSSWPNVTEQGYTTTFRVCSRDDTAAVLLATHLRDGLRMEKAAIVELSGFGGAFATDVFSNTFTSLGGTITSQRMVTSTADYTATLTAIQAENPEVIFYADNDANHAGLLSTTAHGLGMTDVIVAWDTFSYDESVLDDYAAAAGAAAEGDHAVMHHRRTEDMPGYEELNAAYQAAGFPNYGDEVTMWGAFAYDAAQIVIAAIDRADSTAPAAIRDEIAAMADYEGVVGTYEGFDAKGDVIPQWHWIERYENGQWVILHPSKIFLPITLKNFVQ